jgi:hypothetical protein
MSETEPTVRRVDGLEAHEVDDGLVVYQAEKERVHYLNPTASIVFELCNGQHTKFEIAELVRQAWALDDPPYEEIEACLAQLRAEGVIA